MKNFIAAWISAALLAVVAPMALADGEGSVWIGRVSSEQLLIGGTTAYGGAVGFSFLEYFGAEMVIDYMPDSQLPFGLESLEPLVAIDARLDIIALSGNFVVQYPFRDFLTPYATLGYGVVAARGTASTWWGEDLEAWGAAPAWNWGFGAKVHISSVLWIRGDLRWYRLEISGVDLGDLEQTISDPILQRFAIGAMLRF